MGEYRGNTILCLPTLGDHSNLMPKSFYVIAACFSLFVVCFLRIGHQS